MSHINMQTSPGSTGSSLKWWLSGVRWSLSMGSKCDMGIYRKNLSKIFSITAGLWLVIFPGRPIYLLYICRLAQVSVKAHGPLVIECFIGMVVHFCRMPLLVMVEMWSGSQWKRRQPGSWQISETSSRH